MTRLFGIAIALVFAGFALTGRSLPASAAAISPAAILQVDRAAASDGLVQKVHRLHRRRRWSNWRAPHHHWRAPRRARLFRRGRRHWRHRNRRHRYWRRRGCIITRWGALRCRF